MLYNIMLTKQELDLLQDLLKKSQIETRNFLEENKKQTFISSIWSYLHSVESLYKKLDEIV